MQIFKEVLKDFGQFFNPRQKVGLIRLAVFACILLATIIFFVQGDGNSEEVVTQSKGVLVRSVNEFANGSELALVGTVEAIDQAVIQTEVGGRVTSVRVGLGDFVQSGAVIATTENASQYAALLQAEGAYEAAVAASTQSNLGVAEAQNDAVSAFKNSYISGNEVVLTTIDPLFQNPRSPTPGLKIDGSGRTTYLNNERYALNTALTSWKREVDNITTQSDLERHLQLAQARTHQILAIVDAFVQILPKQTANSVYTASELSTLQSNFSTAQATLHATLASIDTALEDLASASISGSGGVVSAADAQIKQALGSLRAAQASYNKTILRTPVSGEVQSLSVRTGDHVSAFTTVATVANQNALEITTYIGSDERNRISVGDTVQIENDMTGTITAIAPAIEQATGKIEVRIQSQSDELQNGDTVRIFIAATEAEEVSDGPIVIPITALKVETDRIVVFTVDNENRLVAHKITEGPLLGTDIVVAEGVSRDMEIVLDARGLNEGDVVTIIN